MRLNSLLYRLCLVTVCALALVPGSARADDVTDWNAVMIRAIGTAATPGPLQGRVAAIVHVAIFDAYNGIDRRYTPIRVWDHAPRGASKRAAVVYAAYTALAGLFPTQSFTADLEKSLAEITDDNGFQHSKSIKRGADWGKRVAEDILFWRSLDGLDQVAFEAH